MPRPKAVAHHRRSINPLTASDVCGRRIYLHCTETFSELEMFEDDTLYKLTYLFTYVTVATYLTRDEKQGTSPEQLSLSQKGD